MVSVPWCLDIVLKLNEGVASKSTVFLYSPCREAVHLNTPRHPGVLG